MNNLKKAVALFLAASSVGAYALSASASDFDMGDVDRSGSVDVYDALLVLKNSVGMGDLDEEQLILADFDEDGIITANDSLEILRYCVRTETFDGPDYNETCDDEYDEEEEDYIEYLDPDIVDSSNSFVDLGTIEYPEITSRTQVSDMKGWAPADVVAAVGPLFTEDQRKTGILASVSMAQFIVESGYGQSRLSLEANNCFGIKGYPGQSTWYGSAWDGESVYTINTDEQRTDGSIYTILDSFRSYDCMEDSIADHSAYLATSMNGSNLRYDGIVGCKDYKKAAQIIKDGGYATALNYVDVICSVIERWNLTQYDLDDDSSNSMFQSASSLTGDNWYRVRLSWEDWQSQLGAYHDLSNAKLVADMNPGYSVYDPDGNCIY